MSEKLLLLGLSLILLFMIVQDWVPLAPLNDVQAIADEHTFEELLLVTIMGVGQFALLLCLFLIFVGKK